MRPLIAFLLVVCSCRTDEWIEPPVLSGIPDVATDHPSPKPGCVTLTLNDVTVRDALEAFEKQVAGVRFELDEKGWPDDFRVRQFIVVNEPWSSALSAFACLAEAEVAEISPGRFHVCRPPRWGGGFRGPVKAGTLMDLVARMTGVNIVMHGSLTNVDVPSIPNVRCTAIPSEVLVEMAVLCIPGATTWRDSDGTYHVVPVER